MKKLKRVLLWIAAIIVGGLTFIFFTALFQEDGQYSIPYVAVLGVALFFIIRALERPHTKKTPADNVKPSVCPDPAKNSPVTPTPVIEEKPDPQPQVIVREVYIREPQPEPQPEPQKKKSWLDSLPETEWERRRKRIAENKKNGVACCPKCGSTSLSVNKKGYSFVKGVLMSPLGGTIGMNKLKVTCLNCGHKFKPGR